MRKILALVCPAIVVGLLASGPAVAVNLFNDNFESGVSSSIWTPGNAGNNNLDGDTGGHHMGNQSAKQVNAFIDGVHDVYYMKTQSTAFTNPGTITAGNKEVATVQFWDDNIRTDTSGDSAINLGGALMLANSALSDFYQMGVNSAVNVNNYYVRTSLGGNVATSVARTQGWHELRIEALPYTGSGDVQFYLDGINVGSGNRRPNTGTGFDLNEVRLGLSIRTPDSPFWFDNVTLDMVPEPASITLIGLGGLALAGSTRSRRRTRAR